MLLSLLRFWTGPLPVEELFPDRKINPFLHWFVHPVKRRIARYYLIFLKSFFGLKVIALTGSTGKTTTSNLLYSVLSRVGPAVKTADSVTTTYNLPSTILRCTPATRYLILEMGVEYKGDMDFYTWLARPDIALLLNVSSVHSSFLGPKKDIFTEKSKLLLSLPENGFAFINSDDPEMAFTSHSRILKFGFGRDCFSRILSSTLTKDMQTKIRVKVSGHIHTYVLPIPAEHLAQNIAVTVALAHLLSLPEDVISQGLSKASYPDHRVSLIRAKNGPVIIDDAYNANPISVSASLHNLIKIARISRKVPVFVFAQMNELGQYEKSAHQEVGVLIKQLKIKHLFTLGPATAYTIRSAGVGRYFDSRSDLLSALKKFLRSDHCVLLKGSHSWHLEELVPHLS